MPEASISSISQGRPPLRSRRGLVFCRNFKGRAFSTADIERWLLLNRVSLKCLKVDLFEWEHAPEDLQQYLESAQDYDLRVSIASHCELGPPPLKPLAQYGLLDVLLQPAVVDDDFDAWLEQCRENGVPFRLILEMEDAMPFLEEAVRGRLISGGLKVFTVLASTDETALRQLAPLLASAAPLREAGIEINFLSFDRASFPTDWQPHIISEEAAETDHQFYSPESRAMAMVVNTGWWFTRSTLYSMTALRTSRLSQLDNLLLRILLHKHPRATNVLQFLHRATRLSGRLPSSLPRQHKSEGSIRVPQERYRYYDEVDAARVERLQMLEPLAKEALRIISSRVCEETLPLDRIEAVNAHTVDLPGARRWFSIAKVEKLSEALAQLEAPFTLRVVLGGGSAEYAGFAIGRRARVLAPLARLDHTLVLHCDAQGNYVLLRDDRLIEPIETESPYYVPTRLPVRCAPCLALWNIDGEITIQAPQVWRGNTMELPAAIALKFSVLVVSVRYARRLQAVLTALARQVGTGPADIEIIVAYVPELDATDDVLNSVELAFPALRLIRAPFTAADAKSKGFLINEAAKQARGEWVVLMDSDIIVGPHFFAALTRATEGRHDLVAPDGRMMLDPETTSKILLGLLDPHAHWDELISSDFEYRQREAGGLPIGFLQCVPRQLLLETPYEEWGHFEGADWRFAQSIREKYGEELWLQGHPVLHLDHGGSQWYGAKRHY